MHILAAKAFHLLFAMERVIAVPELVIVPMAGARCCVLWSCSDCHQTNVAVCPACLGMKFFLESNGMIVAIPCCGRDWNVCDFLCCYCVEVSGFFSLGVHPSLVLLGRF